MDSGMETTHRRSSEFGVKQGGSVDTLYNVPLFDDHRGIGNIREFPVPRSLVPTDFESVSSYSLFPFTSLLTFSFFTFNFFSFIPLFLLPYISLNFYLVYPSSLPDLPPLFFLYSSFLLGPRYVFHEK